MKIIAYCVKREVEDEYMRGFNSLKEKLGDRFHGVMFEDNGYDRLAACRLKPLFVLSCFKEHAPFLYVDADTLIHEIPEIPDKINFGICQNPVQAAKGPPHDVRWAYAASYFFVNNNAAAYECLKRWKDNLKKKGGDHLPFMQSIRGAQDITKHLVGKISGVHRDNQTFEIQYSRELSKVGRQWRKKN